MSVKIGNFNVADYSDYKGVQKKIEEIDRYLKIASDLKNEIYNGSYNTLSNVNGHQYAEELLRKSSYSVGLNNGVWSGKDAESYAVTAREICKDLRTAEDTFVEGLQEVIEHCMEQIEHYKQTLKKIESDLQFLG